MSITYEDLTETVSKAVLKSSTKSLRRTEAQDINSSLLSVFSRVSSLSASSLAVRV